MTTVQTFSRPKQLRQNPHYIVYTAPPKAWLCKRCICYGKSVRLSIRPSVRSSIRPSHSNTVSKQGNAEGCDLHHRVAQCLQFSDAKND